MSDTIKLEVSIDRQGALDALSDNDIRTEYNTRKIGRIDATAEDVEILAALIARGQCEDALTFLRKLAPSVSLLAPSTQMKLATLHQEQPHVHG